MRVFIYRPVLAIALNLVVLIIGLVCWQQLPLRHQTVVPSTEISISTLMPGANNAVVEQRVTKPLEDVLSGLDGIKKVTSVSQDNLSSIYLQFVSSKNYALTLSQVRDRIQSAIPLLPDEVQKPEIEEHGQHSEAIMYIGFYDQSRSLSALSDYMKRHVIERLKMIDGVAKISEFSERPYRIEVQVDSARLVGHGITLQNIIQVLKREKSFAIGGEIDAAIGKQAIVLSAPFAMPNDLGEILLANKDGIPIKLQDVAEIVTSYEEPVLIIKVDGQEITGLSVTVKPRANPLDVAKDVSKFITALEKELPDSMSVKVLHDATDAFHEGIQSVYSALWEAIILVALIVTLSLASFRAAIIPIITIPLCLIGSFILMWVLDFSVNPTTLLAMVLAVGLVVDDAIVVVENIHRHMEEGMSALQAAKAAMSEITFAVVVMTVTLAAVYLPIAFQADEASIKFREFAWTLAGSVLISGFVALTLTPALSSRLLLKTNNTISLFAEQFWQKLQHNYAKLLRSVLLHSGKMILLAIIIVAIGVSEYLRLPAEFEPAEDENVLFGWMVADNQVLPAVEASWHRDLMKVINAKLKVSEKKRLFIGQWRQYRWWMLHLLPRKQRDRGAKEIVQDLAGSLAEIAGPNIGVNFEGFHGKGGDSGLSVVVHYEGDPDVLTASVEKIVRELSGKPGMAYVNSDCLKKISRYKVTVLREIAARLGVRIADIEQTLHAYLTGTKVMDFTFAAFDYDVLVRTSKELRTELDAINQFFVNGEGEVLVPLGVLIDMQPVSEPEAIHRDDRIRSATVQISLIPNWPLEQAMSQVEAIVKQNLPEQASYKLGGVAEKFKESKYTMLATFILALAFIYLVLSALFESFIDPFIVLLTVPMSIIGAVIAINLIHGTNNIVTQIGMITLIGLVTKHGILITDFANRQCQQGKPVLEAIIHAAVSRLRPILMTTLAMVCGAVPLTLGLGVGANAREHLGAVIIGGMTTGTLFSLFVIPVMYLVIARINPRFGIKSPPSNPHPTPLP